MSRSIRHALSLRVPLACAALALTACDDTPVDATPDSTPDATDVSADANNADANNADSGTTANTCLLVTTTEFRTDGGFSVLDANTYDVDPDVTAVHSDAVLRVLGERVFVINRQGADSIQELDPDRGYATASQRSLGGGSNPWSLVPLGDGTAWVPLYNEGTLARVDLAPDAELRTGADYVVSAAAESDDRADVLDAFVVAQDGRDVLFVLVQGLDPYPGCSATSRGRLLALDPFTMDPVDAFDGASVLELAACNPTGFALDGTRLVVGHSGGHRVTGTTRDDGGIEIIDLSTGLSTGLVVNETDLGDRDIVELAVEGDVAWLALADDAFGATVHRATLDPFALGPALWTSENGGVFDLVLADDRVWIADRSLLQPGVVVLDSATGDRVAGPIDVGYPPFDLAVLQRTDGACF